MAKSKLKQTKLSAASNYLVSIKTSELLTPYDLLEQALEESKFWQEIERVRKGAEKSKPDFNIIIKPDFEIYELNSPTGTDPKLVEHLIDLLFEKGYSNIIVADSIGEADLWLENRDVLVLADLIGYQYETLKGNQYEVSNLSENIIQTVFKKESILFDSGISEEWMKSDFRINFCKNKSDEEDLYALGLHNILNILPLKAKNYHYKNRLKRSEVAQELLKHTTVHFNIIDAYVSNHGSQGTRHSNPIETNTIISGNHLLLVDWVGALKMGLDPFVSTINGPILRSKWLPKIYEIKGSLTTYKNWTTSSVFLRESIKKRNQIPSISKLSKPWFQQVETDLFPFKNLIDEQINSFITPLIYNIDGKPINQWFLVALNYLLINLNKSAEAWHILYNKESIYRKEIALGINLNSFKPKDYEDVESYVSPFLQILKYTTTDSNGIKWRFIDQSVLFEYSKIIPTTYEKFIENVDISAAVEMMYDNIGVNRVAVKMNRQKQVVYQAERDIYLPQPNWMVLFGGDYIDVDKIEVIRYAKNEQKIFWRCVNSSNKTAEYDDGMVCFAKHKGGTLVTVSARQKFALPIFWQVVDIDYLPEVKNALVSDSYLKFLSRTMANYEAASEGRSTLIGKKHDKNIGKNLTASQPLEVEHLKQIFSLISGVVSKWSKELNLATGSSTVDENGYKHFQPSNESSHVVNGFFSDINKAIQKDMHLIFQTNENKK